MKLFVNIDLSQTLRSYDTNWNEEKRSPPADMEVYILYGVYTYIFLNAGRKQINKQS